MGCFGAKSKKSRPCSQKIKPKQKAWTQDEWKIHGRYLSQLSRPKHDYAMEKAQQPTRPIKVPLSSLKPRMDTLARPKTMYGPKPPPHDCPLGPEKCHCHVSDPIRKVTPYAKNYSPSKRINMLSQPKLDYQEVVRCFPRKNVMCINKRVLQPPSSYRYKKLAVPKYQYLCVPQQDPYGVKPEALNAVPTQRTVQLAQPKSYSLVMS